MEVKNKIKIWINYRFFEVFFLVEEKIYFLREFEFDNRFFLTLKRKFRF